MNILITLPKNLLEKIISGEKEFEMRKCLPKYMKIGEDGFYVVEKGTDHIRCWCSVDHVFEIDPHDYDMKLLASQLCVSEDYVKKYAKSKKVYLWKIGKVIVYIYMKRKSLCVNKNPQQFAYCSRDKNPQQFAFYPAVNYK